MSDTEVISEAANGQPKRGRGRPKKDPNAPKPTKDKKPAANAVEANGTNGSETELPKKRGRKAAKPETPAKVQKTTSGESAGKRGRGRPKKGAAGKTAAGGKKRGRKPKKAESSEEEADDNQESLDEDKDEEEDE